MDVVKFFAIFLVVWGHLVLIFHNPSYFSYKIIYSFHMPLFMMVSGFFSGSTWNKKIGYVIKNKAQHLLIPVLLCTILEATINYMMTPDFSIAQLKDIIIGNSWFLKTLFVIFIISYLTKRIIKNDYLGMIICTIVVILIPHSYTLQINNMVFYFWFGILLNHHISSIEKFKWPLLLICTVWFVCFHVFFYHSHITIYSIPYIIDNVRLFFCQYLTAIAGSMIVLILSKLLYESYKNSKITKWLSTCGQYTLEIYLVQTVLVCSFMKCALDIEMNAIMQNLLSPILSIPLTYFCIICSKFIGKNKIASFICFGKINK